LVQNGQGTKSLLAFLTPLIKSRLRESTKRLNTQLNLKPNQNRVDQRKNKAAATTTTARLENKAAEIKTQTMRQTIYT
jgi:hypothetical protein